MMKRLFSETPIPIAKLNPTNTRRPGWIEVVVSVSIVVSFFVVAALAHLIAPFGETESVGPIAAEPDRVYIFGTDFEGRDLFSRTIFSIRNTVAFGLSIAILSLIIGLSASIIAMVYGRWMSNGLFLVAHVASTLPAFYLAIFAMVIVREPFQATVLGMTIVFSARVFRLCNSGSIDASLVQARKDFPPGTRFRWPKIVATTAREEKMMLAANFGIVFNVAILTEIAVSFFGTYIGFGIQLPWASPVNIILENSTLISFGEYLITVPLIATVAFMVVVNLLIDCLLRCSGRQFVPSVRSYGPVWDIQN